MSVCYLNGKFLDIKEAKISPLDRGFLFGDSIYEVIASYKKKPFKIDEHLDRLFINLENGQPDVPFKVTIGGTGMPRR